MWATDVIEEMQRTVMEFGDKQVVLVDEMEPNSAHRVTSVEFDAENDAIAVSADR